MKKKKGQRKEPPELDRQVDRMLGEDVRVKMRGPRSSHSRSLAGLCIAVDGHQVFNPAPGAHVIVIELRYVEDAPPPPPISDLERQLLREAQARLRVPVLSNVLPRKK